MDVVEPSNDVPIRRYVPRVVQRVELDAEGTREKPGSVAQARVLTGMFAGRVPPPESATLADAEAAIARLAPIIVRRPSRRSEIFPSIRRAERTRRKSGR